jgi:hypothetical protein
MLSRITEAIFRVVHIITPACSPKFAPGRTHDGSRHHKRVVFHQALALLRLQWRKDTDKGGTTPRTEDAGAEKSGVVAENSIGDVRSIADAENNVEKESIGESIAARPGRREKGPAKRR